MNSAPWTEIGRLQNDVGDLKSQLYGKAESHEIRQTNSNADRLEHSLREISSLVAELQFNVQRLQEENERLNDRVHHLEEK